MKNLTKILMASTMIAIASSLSALGSVQAAPPKGECLKQLQPPLTGEQKAEMMKIKKETAGKKEKMEQFLMTLSPEQQTQLKACKEAQKK